MPTHQTVQILIVGAGPTGLAAPADTATAPVDVLFREARRMGALVIQVNHPFIPYGYLTSVARGVVPGGFDAGFDLLEINAAAPGDDAKVMHALWDYWNEGHRYYLAGGTDTHDVWNYRSGQVRTFAHVVGAVNAETFARALKAGHAYVTKGPLIYPNVIFGDTVRAEPGAMFNLAFDLESVQGLAKVELVQAGADIDERSFVDAPHEAHVAFALQTSRPTWYSIVVEDSKGAKAYTDPIWIEPAERAP